MYPQDAPYKVYEREIWFSDRWNPLNYGRPFDFSRPFFEQYAQLQKQVPRIALVNVGSINSDYCNSCVFNKNCYLIFGGDRNEDCIYGALPMYCRNCVDCDWTDHCELCYFSSYLENCYQCRFAFNNKNCSDCAFIEDCIGCHECILSFNLRNKSFYIENKPYSKDEYLKKKQEFLNGSFKTQDELWQKFLEFRKNRIVKYGHLVNIQNSSGDYIFESKNSLNCYEAIKCEDCRECWTIFESKDCFNSDYIGKNSVLNFNNVSTDSAYRTWFSYFTISSSDIEYCKCTNFSKNLFACIGVRHKEYCILNKQYSKEDFFALREKIIEHMKKTGERGRYFPKQLSTFPYNESTASFFFPKTKEEALSEGFKWRDEEINDQESRALEIPDNIKDVQNSICDGSVVCEVTKKKFGIIPQELVFYQQQNIPVPKRHSDQRYRDRLALRNSFLLFERSCQKCGVNLKSTYAPDRPETVYCEKCYLATVY